MKLPAAPARLAKRRMSAIGEMVALFDSSWTAEAHAVLTKLQIAFSVLAGLGISVFGIAMYSNANVAQVPGWLAPVAWGSFGLICASCVGVVVTLALDHEKEPGSDDEEAELLPVDEPLPDGEEIVPDLTTVENAEMESDEPAQMEFAEPGSEETVEFSTLPPDE
jgi:hypothetical protein